MSAKTAQSVVDRSGEKLSGGTVLMPGPPKPLPKDSPKPPEKAVKNQGLKSRILRFCREHGADLVGFAPVERWDEADEVPPDFRPRSIWPPARTVIVIGVEMILPIVETTPSILHKELYDTTNRELDQIAYDLARFLNRLGQASIFFPRDGYGTLRALREQNRAAFSHVVAAKYAGMGTIGASHNLLTPEFGPRVRLVSVFTSARVPPDPVTSTDLCILCGACARCCPKKAIGMRKDRVAGDFDATACLEMAEELSARRCYPCGICTKVCPIGKDRLLYRQTGAMRKYLREAEALLKNPDDPDYKSWTHARRYGVAKGRNAKERKEENG
jgi:epoxyqueuosine reductase